MKKLFTLVAMALMACGAYAQDQVVWNFSDWTAQEFTSEYTQDGLTVAASDGSSVTIDSNSKTIEGANNTYECTQRLKLGGAGKSGDGEEARYLKFDVTGNCVINVGLISSSGTSDRELVVATGTFDNVVTSLPAAGSPAAEQSYTYTGGEPTTIYLYSQSGGVNIYYIEVNYTSTGINSVTTAAEVDENAPVYNLAGQRVSKNTKGVLIQNGKKFINK